MITSLLLFLLLSNAVTLRRDKSILYSKQTILILSISSLIAITNLNFSFLNQGLGLYGGLFHATPVTQIFHIFIIIISSLILQLTAFYPRKIWLKNYANITSVFTFKHIYDAYNASKKQDINNIGMEEEQFSIIEYPLIILFVVIGATLLVSASDIVSIFLSIELQSYGLYILSTLYKNSELSTWAGLTYFLLGGLSSCFILLGTSLLYANSGTTNLDGYYIITNLSSLANEFTNDTLDWYKPLYLNISLLIMSVGFLFKISAAPFHFWSPDVYDAIPTIVTTFVAITAKISILIFLLELVHYTSAFYFSFSFTWTSGLLFSSFLSLIVGSFLGLTQFRVKRLFAYSTISHLGFILLALTINSLESIQAFIFYLMQYSITNLNAFLILVTIGFFLHPSVYEAPLKNQYNNLLDKKNSPIQLISQLKGYYYLNPVLALSLTITLFSFIGVPPLLGFFAKQMVLSSALDSGFVFLTFTAILTSVISAVYYLDVIKQIFSDEKQYKANPNFKDSFMQTQDRSNMSDKTGETSIKVNRLTLASPLTINISIITLTLLLFLVFGKTPLSTTHILTLIMFNP